MGESKLDLRKRGLAKAVLVFRFVVSNLKGFSLQWMWPMMRWFGGFTKGFGSRPTFRPMMTWFPAQVALDFGSVSKDSR